MILGWCDGRLGSAITNSNVVFRGLRDIANRWLYINCDKRGVFKGAVAAFVKEQDVVVADTGGGGGGDGWGPSGW